MGGVDVPRAQRTPSWEIPKNKPYIVDIYGFFHPQESLENTINTMGTRLGVRPIVP